MTELETQIKSIDPSAKDALFRRLLYEQSLAYLRPNKNEIIGFNVNLSNNNLLAGYAIIAIQKHTILAYKSDLDEQPKLILFPTIDKLRDPEFDLMRLNVERTVYDDDTFTGTIQKTGTLNDVARDLLPPFADNQISNDDAKAFGESLNDSLSDSQKKTQQKGTDTPTPTVNDVDDNPEDLTDYGLDDDALPTSKPPFDDSFDDGPDFDDSFDDGPDFDDSYDTPDLDEDENTNNDSDDLVTANAGGHIFHQATSEDINNKHENTLTIEDSRGADLNNRDRNNEFKTMKDLTYYVITKYNVNADVANNVANLAMQKGKTQRDQIELAILIFIKLFNMHKIGDNPDEGAF